MSASDEEDLDRCGVLQPETFTLEDARADRAARIETYIANCVLMAVVTSPHISAELIDQAILCEESRPDAT